MGKGKLVPPVKPVKPPKKPVRLILTLGGHMSSITVIQEVPILISGSADAKGNPLPVPTFTAPPIWQSSDTTLLTLTPAADGLSAVGTAVGKIGVVTVTASGTPTGQSKAISGSIMISITADSPASLMLTLGTPTVQTPGTPPPPPPPTA